jgi:hypothetical protein
LDGQNHWGSYQILSARYHLDNFKGTLKRLERGLPGIKWNELENRFDTSYVANPSIKPIFDYIVHNPK